MNGVAAASGKFGAIISQLVVYAANQTQAKNMTPIRTMCVLSHSSSPVLCSSGIDEFGCLVV